MTLVKVRACMVRDCKGEWMVFGSSIDMDTGGSSYERLASNCPWVEEGPESRVMLEFTVDIPEAAPLPIISVEPAMEGQKQQ